MPPDERSSDTDPAGMDLHAPVVTVLTPSFNRARTLPRLYESLRRQTMSSFEWVLVDDGSDDSTHELVSGWVAEGASWIRYTPQDNRGKHVAVNRGVALARGAYTTIVDSDDWLVPEALEQMLEEWARIPESERRAFSGVVGLCAYEDGTIVGDKYPDDPLDCDAATLTYIHGVTGDKQGLLRTDALEEFPFPFEEIRGYVTESLVWNRMALRYKERHVNKVFAVKEYRPGGISDRALELLARAAPATRQFFLEEAALPHALPRKRRFRAYTNYARFSFHAHVGLRAQGAAAPGRVRWLVALPVGTALYLRDRRWLTPQMHDR